MQVTFKDDYVVNLRTGEEYIPMDINLNIKNPIQQFVISNKQIGVGNDEISRAIAAWVKVRGPIGTGRYACTCNNWGPRWIENSESGCCPGCWSWASDHHYEVGSASKLDRDRVTRSMIEKNTWGINVKQLDKNKIHNIVEDELAFPGVKNGRIEFFDVEI